MTRLNPLRRHLSSLGRRRQAALWSAGACAAALAVLWVLVGVYLADWSFNLPTTARCVALAVAGLLLAVVFYQWTWPTLVRRESDVEIALLVEKQQHIDSDLVAALEFESSAAGDWGSTQLQQAVVDYVSEFSSHLDLERSAPVGPLFGRVVALAASAVVILAAVMIYPDYFRTFVNRLFLGTGHYPVNTHIDRVVINGRVVGTGALADKPPRSPYGPSVRFEVHASGELPASGEIELATLVDGGQTTVHLTPDSQRPGVYLGELPRLVDSVRYQVELGDAWTDPSELLAIPLPVVTIALEPTPPDYAASATLDAQPGARQISIVEGTRVAVRLECTNKQLRQATLTIGEEAYPLTRQDDTARLWRLEPAGTPLAHVTEAVRYEVQVKDVDELSLAEPIQGFIRIKTDRPPRVTAALVTHYVLPTGKPSITYGAADDYGIAELKLNVQILHQDGAIEERSLEMPLESPRAKVVQGRYPLELGPLSLTKGDQLKLSLEARDYRGTLPGRGAASEPLVLHVTDERGVLAAMAETDQRSAKQLDAIIQRQLGIGD